MELRAHEIMSLFKTSGLPRSFTAAFEQLREPSVFASKFRLSGHPRWKEAVALKKHRTHFNALASELLYGLDPESQFKAVSNMALEASNNDRPARRVIRAWEKTMKLLVAKKLTLASIWLHAALDHMHLRIPSAGFLSVESPQIRDLGQALRPQLLPDQMHALTIDCEEVPLGPMPQDQVGGVMFMRVVSKKAGRLKLAHLPRAESQRLGLSATPSKALCFPQQI